MYQYIYFNLTKDVASLQTLDWQGLGNICLLFIVGENDAVMLPVAFCNVLQMSSRIGSL